MSGSSNPVNLSDMQFRRCHVIKSDVELNSLYICTNMRGLAWKFVDIPNCWIKYLSCRYTIRLSMYTISLQILRRVILGSFQNAFRYASRYQETFKYLIKITLQYRIKIKSLFLTISMNSILVKYSTFILIINPFYVYKNLYICM